MVTLSHVEMKCFGLGQAAGFFPRHWVGQHIHRGMLEETFALWLKRWSVWREAREGVVMGAGVGGGGEVATFCPAGTQWWWWHAAGLGLAGASPLWEQVPPTGSAGTALISVATVGLCALFFVCSTMVCRWAMMKRRSCRTLFTLFSVSAGSVHLYKAWRMLKPCQTTRIKS